MKMRFKVLMVLVIAAFSLNSCDIGDDDSTSINFEAIPVVNVEVPLSFNFGQTHSIPVLFDYTNTCQQFIGFEVNSNLNERIITVIATTTNSNDCQTQLLRTQEDLEFLAASNGSYVFKFFTGLDVNNEATYLEYLIPVEE